MANKETVQNTRIPVREGNLALDRRVTIGVDAHLDVHVAVALDGLSARLECHLAHLTRRYHAGGGTQPLRSPPSWQWSTPNASPER